LLPEAVGAAWRSVAEMPVLLVAFLPAYSAKSVGKTYNML
jgi:hypothetical protein